jgi:hypothetical protein
MTDHALANKWALSDVFLSSPTGTDTDIDAIRPQASDAWSTRLGVTNDDTRSYYGSSWSSLVKLNIERRHASRWVDVIFGRISSAFSFSLYKLLGNGLTA